MDGATERQLPELPERVTRWTVDRHYTALVDSLRGDGPPGAVSEAAHEALVAQVRTRFPGAQVPDYVTRLGQDTEETARE